MKYFLLFILSFNILVAQENDVRKTSELELFLFKIGFESLLKDVENTKNKTDLNEQQLKNIREQLKLVVDEVYKNKKNFSISNNQAFKDESQRDLQEVLFLKEEIKNLKREIQSLKELKKSKVILVKEKISNKKTNEVKVVVDEAYLRSKPTSESKIVRSILRNNYIKIDFCDNYGWCKLKNEEIYIPKFTLKL